MLNIKRLGLADARKLIKGAKRKAKRIGVPMCIAVADEQGTLIAFERMDGAKIVLIRQASDMGQLYGSVSARDVAEGLIEGGFNVERRQIVLDRPIKTLGLHAVRVMLHPEVSITIEANVARSLEEAERQEAGIFFDDPEREDGELEEEAEALFAASSPMDSEDEAGEGEGEAASDSEAVTADDGEAASDSEAVTADEDETQPPTG